jgi:predicted ATP-dependent Lon-type protease
MKSLEGKVQVSHKLNEVDSISKDTRTINDYYKEKRKQLKLNRRSIVEKVDSDLLKFIVKNPTQTKRMITKSSKNKFISDKIVKEIIKKCKNIEFPLEYSHTDLLEENLKKLTQAYIKEGRHKVIM